MSHDAIVVGTGVAGLTAAVRLAEGGARVLVLAKGVGSTHLTGATIDVLGNPYMGSDHFNVGEAIARLPADHPYARVGGAPAVAAALDWLRAQVADGPLEGYEYAGGLERNRLLPTAVGALKPTAMAPVTMLGGEGRDPVAVVGFRQLKDFHPALVADNLARAGIAARSIELDVAVEGRADANAQALARHFDDPAARGAVAGQLAGRMRAGERVGLPAVLGLRDPARVWRELEHRLGRPVFEIPTLPPSAPGMRLYAILRAALRRLGGRVILGAAVTGPLGAGARLDGVRAAVGRREVVHRAGEVILATGGFAAGGLVLDSRWAGREAALGLPLAGMPAAGEPRFTAGYFDEQPMARAGVAVDGELRPVGRDGAPVHANVRVVGASLAGAAPWREKSGDGISLSSGHRAAELILGAAARPAVAA